MKKVLFPLMAVVLALALAVPMAAPVAAAETPMTIVSNTDVMVTAGNTGGGYPYNAVEAWLPFDVAVGPAPANQYWDYYSDYDFSLLGAKWIWESYRVVHPVDGDIVEFERTFTIPGPPTHGELRITCDNGYEAYLNGDLVSSGQVHDYSGTAWEDSDLTENWVNCNDWTTVEKVDVTGDLVPGVNVLHIIAANEYMNTDDALNKSEGTIDTNPAGLIFELELAYTPAEELGKIKICKSLPYCCPCGSCPKETFTFEAYKDGVPAGTATITGSGWATIDNLEPGKYTVCEELIAGSAYQDQPCQDVEVKAGRTATVYFSNKLKQEENPGKIKICKSIPWRGPEELFTFEAYKDGVPAGTATITGSGWATIDNLEPGTYKVHEGLQGDSKYQQPRDQTVTVRAGRTATVYFYNKLGGSCWGY